MHFLIKVAATLVLLIPLLQVSGDSAIAATNCGFLTLEQCRATVRGLGGFCVSNQFYNPQTPAKEVRKRHAARANVGLYDQYPWCADWPDNGS